MMSEQELHCPAPAKINLFLHVTGRRPDGYHLLQSAFRMLDRADDIVLRRRGDGEVTRSSDLPGVPAEQDLVVRAARLMQARTGCRLGVDIAVTKRLPMGGGLGGGSSDAASVMLGLNRLWGLDVPRASLQEWGLSLGADVPFFLFGRTALAEGVGEQLRPLNLPPAWYVVVEPPVSVPTPQIFAAKELTRDSKPLIMSGFPAKDCWAIENEARNDLQPVACGLYPPVREALDALAAYGVPRMSGSGACVFLACESKAAARKVEVALADRWTVWVAASLERHPLWDAAGEQKV